MGVEAFQVRSEATRATDPLARYHRQMLLQGWGREGQDRLSSSHAVIVGLGALGCQSADLLARAGVGTLTLIDRDLVEFTNLQRQTLYTERDASEALPKAQAAAARLAEVNSSIALRAISADLSAGNALELIGTPDILIDGTDNFETRFLLNDLAVKLGIPFAYAGVIAARAMQLTVVPKGAGNVVTTPCLRCIFEELPQPGTTPTCDTAGVFGPAVAIIAGAQAGDALKLLAGRADLLSHSMLEFDLWTNQRRRLDLRTLGPRADCPCCGRREFEFLDGLHASEPTVLCGQNAVQVSPLATAGRPHAKLELGEFAARWKPLGEVSVSAFMVRVRPRNEAGAPLELSLFGDGRAIVRGTTSIAVARSLYARLVGA